MGASVSAYLGVLKATDSSCGGGCEEAFNSSLGTIAGMPVGFWGFLLWLLVLAGFVTLARVAALILAVGAMIFAFVQFLTFASICAFCMVHTGCALVAAALILQGERTDSRVLGVPLLFTMLLAMRPDGLTSSVHQQAGRANEMASSANYAAESRTEYGPTLANSDASVGLMWFGVGNGAVSTHLVLSLGCHHCLDLLLDAARAREPWINEQPSVLLGVAPDAFSLTQEIVAATLCFDEPVRGFREVFAALAPMRDQIIRNELDPVSRLLQDRFPSLVERRFAAEQILMDQARVLIKLPIQSTPVLIRGGRYTYSVVPELLFGAEK